MKRLVRQVVADMKSEGEPLPEPLGARRYSGVFEVRIPPFLHRKLALEAASNRISLNRLVSAKLADR